MTEQQEAAMRQALEALIEVTGWQWAGPMRVMDEVEDAITALTAALADHALDKKAENARELGLDYGLEQDGQCKRCADGCPACDARKQPAQQEPVIDKSAAIRIATALGWEPKRDWVGLLWGELPKDDVNHDFLRGAEWAEAKLREKNT